MIKRLDCLEIATTDLADTAGVYEKNFDFRVQRNADSSEAIIVLGDSYIKLRPGDVVNGQLSSEEGLAAIWFEADDIYKVAEALKNANIAVSGIRVEADRRILAVAPSSANMVPLFIFDRP